MFYTMNNLKIYLYVTEYVIPPEDEGLEVLNINKEQVEILLAASFIDPPKDVLWLTDDQELIDQLEQHNLPVAAVETNNGGIKRASFVFTDVHELEVEDFYRVYQRFNNMPWYITESERTYIREIDVRNTDDLDALISLYNEPGITDYMEGLYEYDKEKEYQENYVKYIYKFYGYGLWLVFSKENNKLIGRAGLESRDKCAEAEAEMGYVIAVDYQNQGYAYEVCQAIIDYAKKNLNLNRLKVRIHPYNEPSIRLAASLGFTGDSRDENGDRVMMLEINNAWSYN